MQITVLNDPAPSDWAHWGPPPGKAGSDADKKKIAVEGLGFKAQSPGAEVSTLGHEMVHYLQHQRTNYTFIGNIMGIVDDLREVEAYAWETGQVAVDIVGDKSVLADFTWPGHDASTLACGDTYERQTAQASASCYEWKVQHAISQIVSTLKACETSDTSGTCESARAQMESLQNWLGPKGDIWAGPSWAKQHPNWASFQDSPIPVYTVKKDDGNIIPVDCNTF
jgi:hypothetical protein